tara:strand:- start:40 stop:228 length:189 start_codon:yes stop_codon:yes gene_type:complete
MAKKKLTKAQVKKKFITINKAMTDLVIDKLEYGVLRDSKVPMSPIKLMDIQETLKRAAKRIK